MRRVLPFALALGAVVMVASLGIFGAADEKPKYTIKEVMKEAHKEGLLKKVSSGKASKEEKEKLLALYIALHQNKPPQGDAKEFATQSEGIVSAAKAVVEGKEGAEGKLAKAVNCGNCHSKFKPK